MLNKLYKQNPEETTANDHLKALRLAELIQGKVVELYQNYLQKDSFQEFIDGRSDFIQYNKSGTTKLITIDGETDNERKQLAQLQAFYLEWEI
jgi:uncharacterized protein YccT (UPF0319 family)